RKALPVSNTRGRQPDTSISASSDSRTDTSSSTTNTVGLASDMAGSLSDELDATVSRPMDDCMAFSPPLSSSPRERRVDGLDDRGLAERLDQAGDGAPPDQLGQRLVVGMRSDEHDRDLGSAPRQLLLKLRPAHASHGDVENQAIGAGRILRCEKRFGGGERLGVKPERPQQIRQRLAH